MSRDYPLHYGFRPIIEDRRTAAWGYFLCVIGMLFLESLSRVLAYLLSRDQGSISSKGRRAHWSLYVAVHRLTTRPSPIPFALLTDHDLTSITRCLVFVGFNVLWGWNRIRYTTDYQLYGWLTIANAGLALLLPTGNNIMSVVGRIPPPVLLAYHRWAGMAAVAHASLHFGLTVQRYVDTNQFDVVSENARIRVGILAWAALATMFATSLRILRRRAFELFYYTHFLFLVFVGGALYHASHGPEFLLPGLCLWIVDRVWRLRSSFRDVPVRSITHYSGDVVKIKLEGVKTKSAVEMAWVQFPSISKVNWHPFTIASAPGDETATIAIRARGGYTRRVRQTVENHHPTTGGSHGADIGSAGNLPLKDQLKVRLDGPYGVSGLRWERHRVVAIVAGGIGITPGISVMSHIAKMASRPGYAGSGWHVYLLWSLSNRGHASWFEEELKDFESLAARTDIPLSLNVSIHVTGHKPAARDGVGSQEELAMEEIKIYDGPGQLLEGRPSVFRWFEGIRDAKPDLDVAVHVCGPQSLKNDTRRAAAQVSSKRGLFFVEEEVFEF